jgi:hypothetical protein
MQIQDSWWTEEEFFLKGWPRTGGTVPKMVRRKQKKKREPPPRGGQQGSKGVATHPSRSEVLQAL